MFKLTCDTLSTYKSNIQGEDQHELKIKTKANIHTAYLDERPLQLVAQSRIGTWIKSENNLMR